MLRYNLLKRISAVRANRLVNPSKASISSGLKSFESVVLLHISKDLFNQFMEFSRARMLAFNMFIDCCFMIVRDWYPEHVAQRHYLAWMGRSMSPPRRLLSVREPNSLTCASGSKRLVTSKIACFSSFLSRIQQIYNNDKKNVIIITCKRTSQDFTKRFNNSTDQQINLFLSLPPDATAWPWHLST